MKTRRMARIALQSGLYKAWMKQLRRVVYEEYFYDDPLVHPVQYPQSLGELCIELAQESMQAHAGDGNYISYLLMSGMRPSTWPLIKSIRVLRIAMYHKEKA